MQLLANDISTNLLRQPNFFKGFSRVFDLFGKLDNYNYSETEEKADFNALRKDWEMIGEDLLNAIKKYESSIGK